MKASSLHPAAIGIALRSLREAKCCKAKDLAQAAGLPAYELSRLENGRKRLDFQTALVLVEAMGADLNLLAQAANAASEHLGAGPDSREQLESVRAQASAQLRQVRADLVKAINDCLRS